MTHWYYLTPYESWEKISRSALPRLVLLSDMYPTRNFIACSAATITSRSLWMKHELLEQGRGGLLITGSTSEGEHFTYNQQGSGNIQESCVTAYFLAGSTTSCDWKAICGMAILWNGRFTTLCSGRSPQTVAISVLYAVYGKRSFQNGDTFCCNGNLRRG